MSLPRHDEAAWRLALLCGVQDEIREGLDRVCEMLPRTVSRECQEFVNTFLEEIIDMVVSGMTADQVCITLGLCSGSGHLANDLGKWRRF